MIVKDFDMNDIYDSGQCFRWKKINDSEFIGVIANGVCRVIQNGDDISFIGVSEDVARIYFDLDRDYGEIKSILGSDEIMKKAIAYGPGLRILNQDRWETLVSFIISANNNIPRISSSIEKLSQKFGQEIILGNKEYYLFPTAEELKDATEEEIRECGVGFRAKYIKKAVFDYLTGNIDLDRIADMDYDSARKELLKVTGVGPKVANCILLFSMQKIEAFPIDVWIKKMVEELYFGEEKSNHEIEAFAKERFGDLGGIAQQYLFNARKELT